MLVKDETVGGPDRKRIAKIIQKIEVEYPIHSMQELLVTSSVIFFVFKIGFLCVALETVLELAL